MRVLKDLDQDVSGRDVIVTAGDVDTGLSIRYVVDFLERRGPARSVCALLDWPVAASCRSRSGPAAPRPARTSSSATGLISPTSARSHPTGGPEAPPAQQLRA
ncbi:MAG: hypothetical protein WB383_00315 [Acidimicrobiales bacterium]